jgi:ribonuclease Z
MQVVEVRGKQMMVDCGEGAQVQLRRHRIRFTRLSHVFISHQHGDHCLGLVGMISSFGLLDRTAPLHIYGPAPLGQLLRQALLLFCPHLSFEVCWHDVDPARHQVVYEDRSITVESLPLCHTVPTCGFLFREKPTLPHIRPEMMRYYDIPLSQVHNIKAGQDVVTPEGKIVPASCLTTPADPPRSYAYCSDTCYLPDLHQLLQGVSTLYHEATYGEDRHENARKYKHSTARQAGTVARDAHVGKLLLGHYSQRYEDETVLLDEARAVFPNTFLTQEMQTIEV